ncbi:nucleosidase [Paenibacillus amylolyticus]|uniref:HAD hydrolase-like protein n=1 Tax=Paenibacillus TaxID=44249 RepID=UPI0003E23A94|nr:MULTISPECIES: HAD hydrolase-like protein [Paenibacillus]ETT37236.1 bifunctional 5'-methylthioadenosine/S-adenosylhomocysteine nucleosidase/phosphatase [Paenibacillus sp. FSL R5-192]OMF09329.1 nucleosidase [Paenibacillus amylolyticus]
MLEAVIFDMDGTLFQTNKILELSLEETFTILRSLNEWSSEAPTQKYREIMGVPLPVVWETLLPNHSTEIRRIVDEIFLEKLIANINNGNGALYPHVNEIFDYLKHEGYFIFIASNGLNEYLNAIVNCYKLDKWVAETYSIQQIGTQNKDDLVGHILKKHHISNATVVGDRISDFNAAKNNGLKAIGCRFDFAQEGELAQADFIIDDLLELKNIFKHQGK